MKTYRYTVTFDTDADPDSEEFSNTLVAAFVQFEDAEEITTANVRDEFREVKHA